MILYHGTSTKRLPAIEKQGLIPTAPKASKGDDFVYLTDNPIVAALFSGHGRDSQGFSREGYMTPLSAKLQTGIVLKVRVDPKYLEDDQIWSKKVKEIKDPNFYKKIYDEILHDLNRGNPVLEHHVETVLYEIWKESGLEADGESYDPELMSEEDWDYAIDTVVSREAKKELKSMTEEAKRFLSGKLYQYSQIIPRKDILSVIPASKFLKKDSSDSKNFGNQLQLAEM